MKIFQDIKPKQSGDLRQIHATNLPLVLEDDATPEVKQLYQEFREAFSRMQVPGILQCFATHPPLLNHMIGLAKSMLFIDGALGRQHKEMIYALVSAANKCEYCADSHGHSFRLQGGSASALDAVLDCDLESQSINAQERTLLAFVKKITEDSHAIMPTDIDRMRMADWTDLQIAEAIHVTALFAAFNRIVNSFGLPSQELLKLVEQPPQGQEDDSLRG
jgi:uncharacterized peroxidase-related enzyme